MNHVSMLLLPGATHGSAGIWRDLHVYAERRIGQVLGDESTMETRFAILSTDGSPIAMSDGGLLAVDGSIASSPQQAFIWLPSFLAGGAAPLRALLAKSAPVLRWLQGQRAGGAVIGASGPAVLLMVAAGLTENMALPLPPALRSVAMELFPGLSLSHDARLADTGDIILSAGIVHDPAALLRGIGRVMGPHMEFWLNAVFALPVDTDPSGIDPLMLRARLWLEQTFASNIGVATLAARLSISRSALNRKFMKAFGVSPKAYVQSVRLEAAQQMLAKTDRKVDEVAAAIGYSDTRLFRAMFHKQTGMSPRVWRQCHHVRDDLQERGRALLGMIAEG